MKQSPDQGTTYEDFERDFAGLIDRTDILTAAEQLRVREQVNKQAYAQLIQLGANIRLRKAAGDPQTDAIGDYFNSKKNLLDLYNETQALRRRLGPLADAEPPIEPTA